MARVNEAWSVLSSPLRRARWDRDHVIVHPAHWAAAPVQARQPMRPPPSVAAGSPSVRDSGWLAVVVAVSAALLLGAVLLGIALTADATDLPRMELDGLTLQLPEEWVAHAGDGTDPAGHRVIAHLASYGVEPAQLCTSFESQCPIGPGDVPAGEASVVITGWSDGTPPIPDPILSRPFGRDAERIIGGEPAAFELRRSDEGAIAWWQLSPPGFPDRWIEVRAFLGGGRFEQDRGVRGIDEMLRTLRFTDP